MTIKSNPMLIPGRWRQGYSLDFHTIGSTYLGDDEYGHPRFDTQRTEIGELLYRLKYSNDGTVAAALVDAAASFLASWNPGTTIIAPVPPSRERATQPVHVIGEALADRVGIRWGLDSVHRIRDFPELKDIYDYGERIRLLDGAYQVDRTITQDQRVLLFDDLFRSGATLNAVTAALYDQGGAADVFALTLTRTRSNR